MAETGERRQIASRRSGEPVYESLEQVAQRQAAERASGVGGSLAVLNAQPSDFTPSGPGVPAGVYSDEELSRRIESQRMNEQQDAAERQREIAAIEEQKQNPDTITPGHPVVDHVRLGREAFEKTVPGQKAKAGVQDLTWLLGHSAGFDMGERPIPRDHDPRMMYGEPFSAVGTKGFNILKGLKNWRKAWNFLNPSKSARAARQAAKKRLSDPMVGSSDDLAKNLADDIKPNPIRPIKYPAGHFPTAEGRLFALADDVAAPLQRAVQPKFSEMSLEQLHKWANASGYAKAYGPGASATGGPILLAGKNQATLARAMENQWQINNQMNMASDVSRRLGNLAKYIRSNGGLEKLNPRELWRVKESLKQLRPQIKNISLDDARAIANDKFTLFAGQVGKFYHTKGIPLRIPPPGEATSVIPASTRQAAREVSVLHRNRGLGGRGVELPATPPPAPPAPPGVIKRGLQHIKRHPIKYGLGTTVGTIGGTKVLGGPGGGGSEDEQDAIIDRELNK